MKGRLLGIDHGKLRIGLAISDGLGIGARELAVLPARGSQEDFQRILAVAREQGAAGLVVGVPRNPNAPAGLSGAADTVQAWIAQLRSLTELPIAEVGEYLTSAEARILARQLKRKPEQPIDDLAARVILQAYLDAQSYASAGRQAPGEGD